MASWRVHTSTLFYSLLDTLPNIDLFLDVGSLDGRECIIFEALFPNTPVFAFEPNPHNIEVIRKEIAQRHSHLTLEPFAVGNESGTTSFYVRTPLFNSGADGTSSIVKSREESHYITSTIEVPLRRLDDIDFISASTKIALWIDTEGAGYFV